MGAQPFVLQRLLPRRLLVVLVATGILYSLLALNTASFLNPHVITSNGSTPEAATTELQIHKLEEALTQHIESNRDELSDHMRALLAQAPSEETSTTRDNIVDPSSSNFVDYVERYDENDLRSRLAKSFPYDRSTKIPKLIWQIWKEPIEQVKNNEVAKYMHSWAEQVDDGYEYRVVTDADIDTVVSQLYGNFSEIIDAFKAMPLDILKFDFLRYLLLYARGGIYSDVDALAFKPLKSWADSPNEITDYISDLPSENVGFVVGIEGDHDRPDWRFFTSRRLQFCQWTFKSKPGHPVLRELIHKITQTTLKNYSERLNHVKIGRQYYTLHSVYTVLEWTGPAAFTDALFSHFNKVFNIAKWTGINKETPKEIKNVEFEEYHKEKNRITEKKHVGWTNFTRLMQPAMFDDVLVLPIASFNGFADDLPYKVDDELVYVKHEFHGTWKNM